MNSGTPIFIHSLFRTGSTYVFHAFRRSPAGYCCYQEPLHEAALAARHDPQGLLSESESKMARLRHPQLQAPYFQELCAVADACLDKLSKSAVYDAYFGYPEDDIGLGFWKALIAASPSRPVIQECRTSSRLHAIKAALGGFHIYLWRNPWDQWWSTRIDDYFEAAHQLFLNAPCRPPVIDSLRREIAFTPFRHPDIQQQFAHFQGRLLDTEHSYLLFYVLWCLGLRTALQHAHLLINMDRLSESRPYRHSIEQVLAAEGIGGLDFSDCLLPRLAYQDWDRAFFQPQEDRARGLFVNSGLSEKSFDHLQRVRLEYAPAVQKTGGDQVGSHILQRDLIRSRELYIQSVAARCRDQALARKAEKQRDTMHEKTELTASELETWKKKALRAKARQDGLKASLQRTEAELARVYASTSWRLSRPIRWGGAGLRFLRQLVRRGKRIVSGRAAAGGANPAKVGNKAAVTKGSSEGSGGEKTAQAGPPGTGKPKNSKARPSPSAPEMSATARHIFCRLQEEIKQQARAGK